MRKGFCYILSILTLVLTLPVPTGAQNIDWLRAPKKSAVRATECDTLVILPWFDEELANDVCVLDSMNIEPDTVITEPLRPMYPIPLATFGPPLIFDSWQYLDSIEMTPKHRDPIAGSAFDWIDDLNFGYLVYNHTRQNYMINNPDKIKLNVRDLPEPPAHYNAFVDPVTTRIVLEETVNTNGSSINGLLDIQHINWIQNFTASAQFSQAYVSPNWYQGGNRSLIAIVNLIYNVKLNQKLHPKLQRVFAFPKRMSNQGAVN